MAMFERIKELAKKRGKNLKQVALDMGFGENYFYTLKTQSPKAETLEKIADYFNVSIDYLLGRTNIKSIPEDNNVPTFAAHHDGEEWTEAELDEIEEFKRFVAMRREARKNKGD
ncbi:helix-turn-helix domain-containing protein [Lysinibacillus sphaericus]|uniref:helix-turn-helix domain-containing protein n=1 Tax=Lysinibacillus sphaericus TaxID=1421 RepID=UPI003D015F2E